MHRALLFMALAVGAEAEQVADQMARQAIRTMCARTPDVPPQARHLIAHAMSGRAAVKLDLAVLLPPALRDNLEALVARLTFDIPFELVQQGAGRKRGADEGGGVVIPRAFGDKLVTDVARAASLVKYLVEYVDSTIVFEGRYLGNAPETKRCGRLSLRLSLRLSVRVVQSFSQTV